jgi:hypothetical protein
MKSTAKQPSSIFALKNIDIKKIETKYDLHPVIVNPEFKPQNTTSVDELYSNTSGVSHSFVDDNKKYVITMVDCITNKQLSKTNCFWCRHKFDTRPIGCPVYYDTKTGIYQTEGIFCSFNCCLAYINDYSDKMTYKHSRHLLMKMYIDIFKPGTIKPLYPSPHWRLLADYGGNLTIEEFRNSFQNSLYIDKNCLLSTIPRIKPLGKVYEEVFLL